ncbi:hypothetical protein KI387_043148, partial [Taxus chinensis]
KLEARMGHENPANGKNFTILPRLRGKAKAGARGLVWPSRYGEIWSYYARRGDIGLANHDRNSTRGRFGAAPPSGNFKMENH